MNDHLLKVCDERFDSITFPIYFLVRLRKFKSACALPDPRIKLYTLRILETISR